MAMTVLSETASTLDPLSRLSVQHQSHHLTIASADFGSILSLQQFVSDAEMAQEAWLDPAAFY